MLLLSSSFASLIEIFAPLFGSRVWSYAELLLVGAVLAPGKRTVSSVLRIVGLGSEKHFQNYHRVLNRARWSGRAACQILRGLLLRAFSPCGPILVGLDDTIERRWGKQIQARGIYRDPVRSSHSHFVTSPDVPDVFWSSLAFDLPQEDFHMQHTLPQSRIKHIAVLMPENRSFDHLFGFFQQRPGQTIENLQGAHATLSNLLDPSQPASTANPNFTVSHPAPFAVHDKEGPSHSFNAVCVQLCNDQSGPSSANPVRNNGFVRSYKD